MKSPHSGDETHSLALLACGKKFILEVCYLMKYFHLELYIIYCRIDMEIAVNNKAPGFAPRKDAPAPSIKFGAK